MTLDANIIIAYLGGDEKVITMLDLWQQEGKQLFLSTVAETEILAFAGWTKKEQLIAEKFLEENFISIPFDRELSRIAADIRRVAKTKLPDAAIAATALFTRTPLVTRNLKDFKYISGLQVLTI